MALPIAASERQLKHRRSIAVQAGRCRTLPVDGPAVKTDGPRRYHAPAEAPASGVSTSSDN